MELLKSRLKEKRKEKAVCCKPPKLTGRDFAEGVIMTY
jgi:hypothetical protein